MAGSITDQFSNLNRIYHHLNSDGTRTPIRGGAVRTPRASDAGAVYKENGITYISTEFQPGEQYTPDYDGSPELAGRFADVDSSGRGLGGVVGAEEAGADAAAGKGLTAAETAKMGLYAAEGIIDILNAQNKYTATVDANNRNMVRLQGSIWMTMSEGERQALFAEGEGRKRAESSALAMAVQGQDVNAAATQKIEAGHEQTGIYNGMIQRINAMNQAMGLQEQIFDLQRANIAAQHQRDMSVLGGVAKAGIGMFTVAAGG